MSAPVTQFPAFVDQSVSPPGTLLAQVVLDTLVIAQGCLVSGGIPSLSGTLTLTQPATIAVVNTGTSAALAAPNSQSLTFTASKDTYIDLLANSTYNPVVVANGALQPPVTAGSTRLYKAVSSGTAVTAVSQLASAAVLPATGISAASEAGSTAALTATSTIQDNISRIWGVLGSGGLTQTSVTVDNTEAAANTSLSGGSLLSNMNRIRFAITTALGLTWTNTLANTKAAILQDGVNSASPSLAGTVTIPSAIPASANGGLLQVGPAPFDGTSSGHFVGASAGTAIAVNAASGFIGSLLDLQVAGVSAVQVQSNGLLVTGPVVAAPTWSANGGSGITGGTATGNQMGGTVTLTMTSLVISAGTRVNWGKFTFASTGLTPKSVVISPVGAYNSWLQGTLQITGFDNTGFTLGYNPFGSGTFTQINAQFNYSVAY